MPSSPRPLVAAVFALVFCALFAWLRPNDSTRVERVVEFANDATKGAVVEQGEGYDPEAFHEWLVAFETVDEGERVTLARRGASVLAGRREWMAALIVSDPEQALEEAVRAGDRALLPRGLVDLLETPVSARGAYEVEVACGLDTGGSETRRFVDLDDGRRLAAYTFGRRLDVPCKDRIAVHGIEAGGVMALDTRPLRELSAFEREAHAGVTEGAILADAGGQVMRFSNRAEFEKLAMALEREELMLGPAPRVAYSGLEGESLDDGSVAESAWTEGDKTVLYLRVQFSDDDPGREDLSFEAARGHQDDVEEFMEINSYGKSRWTTTITDTIWLENTAAYYQGTGWSTMLNDARAIAITMGQAEGEDWDYNNYDFYTLVSRGGFGGYAGVAQVGGRRSHLQSKSLRTAGHEYGHNLGLLHANYHYTKSLNPRGESTYEGFANVEYGHRFSIQSAQSGGDFNNPSRPHFSVHEKWRLDWLTDADMIDITDASHNGVHRVFQNDRQDATGLRALRLPSGGAMSKYWVSYRAAWNNEYLSNGAIFDWTSSGGGRSTLLDMTPYSDDGSHSGADWTRDNRDKWDAALAIGRTYSDHESGVHVTPLARGGTNPDEYLDLFVHVEGGAATTLLGETDDCRAIVPDATTPTDWAAPGFDDSAWTVGSLGVGYERNSGYAGFFSVDLEAGMYNGNESAYIRAPFEIADAAGLALDSMSLQLRYDDGFVAYLNGVKVAEANAPAAPVWDSGATDGHSDSSATSFVSFDISSAIGELVVGTNVLAIHGLNDGSTSSDFLIQPRLVAVPTGAANTPPTVSLAASGLSAGTGGQVAFTATGDDADGDALSYAWHFDEGDAYVAEGQNSATASKSWSNAGQYLVRVTCSDRKGGIAEASVVVTVGEPGNNRQIRGRVLRGGEPVAGARVTGGGKATTTAGDGSYALVGLSAGPHEILAQADGEVLVSSLPNPIAPAPIEWGADFWAMGRGADAQSLTVSPYRATVEIGEPVDLSAIVWDNAAPADESAVPFGAMWRYLDDGTDQGTAWRAAAFDDTAWAEGPAELGFGEGDEATVVSFGGDSSNVHTTTYFRHGFDLANVSDISRARLRMIRDDGVVVFLNGGELLRENMTSGTVSFGTESRNEISGSGEDEVLEFAVDPALLLEGTNVLAVEIHQEDSDSGDLSFDLELVVARNLSEVTPVWSTTTGAAVDAAGVFTATAPGVYVVGADSAGLSGSAEITVPSDLLVSIETVDGIASEYGGDNGRVRVVRAESVGELTVDLAVAGDAVYGADYAAFAMSVTLPDGTASAEFDISPIDDGDVEGNQSVVVSVMPSALYSVGTPGSATVWIEDDDFATAPTVSIAPLADTAVGVPVALAGEGVALQTLVPREAAWHYLDDGSDAGSAWRAPAFDDAAWASGFGSLGYGDNDEATVVSDGGGPRAITTYFRRRFGVVDLAGMTGISVDLQRDDGAVVYLNGSEVLRANMPAGAIDFETRAAGTVGGNDEDIYFADDLPGVLPVVGDNVLAVEVHQTSNTSSDISFDLSLAAVLGQPALLWEKVSGPGNVAFSDFESANPTAIFDQAGTYVLRLTADDGVSQGSAEQSVNVVPRDYTWWASGFPALADADPLADPDGDGRANLFEYAFGSDPGARDAGGDPVATAAGDGILLSYRRLVGGTGTAGAGYGIGGVQYFAEVATDLGSWGTASSAMSVEEVGVPSDNGDGTETITLRLLTGTASPTSERWFVRITVTEP